MKNYNSIKIRNYSRITSCCVLVMLFTMFLTVGFSAFFSSVNVKFDDSVVRVQADMRVTNVSTNNTTNGAVSNFEDYNINNITSSVDLPNIDSTITYQIEVTNIGNTMQGIYSIDEIYKISGTNTDSNLEIKSKTVNLKEALCDSINSNQCKLGSVGTFTITIGYATNGYNASNTSHTIELDFDFRRVFDITYTNFTNTSTLPKQMIYGDTLNITFDNTSGIPSNVLVVGCSSSYTSPTLTLSNISVSGLNDTIDITRAYSVTYSGFTGNTSSLISSIISSGATITFNSTTGIPTSVNVTGATSSYSNPTLTLTNVTTNVVVTGIFNTSEPDVQVINNPDGSTTTITTEIDSHGNEVITGYEIDTNGQGGYNVPSSGLDTGVLAFDEYDFTVSLTAKLTFANCTKTICPLINVTDKKSTLNGLLIYEVRSTSGYGHDINGNNVSTPYNKFRFGKYVSSSATGSDDYNITSKVTQTVGNGRYGYNSSSSPVTLTFKLYKINGIFSSEIYNSSGTLLALPHNNVTFDFGETGSDFSEITVELGKFTSSTGASYDHTFEIIDFSVQKSI